MVSKAHKHFNFTIIYGRFYNYPHLRFHDTFRPAGAAPIYTKLWTILNLIHLSPRWGLGLGDMPFL